MPDPAINEITLSERIEDVLGEEFADLEGDDLYQALLKEYKDALNKYNIGLSSYNTAKERYDLLIEADPNADVEPPVELGSQPASITYSATSVQLSKLKTQIQPYANFSQLYETLNNMIQRDPDYIRKYLASYSNIFFQKDFIIDNINKYTFTSVDLNDSTVLDSTLESIILSYKDFELYSHNHSFVIDVFINGIKLSKKCYKDIPSSKTYNFKTGERRLIINKFKTVDVDGETTTEQIVKDGDVVSVVVRKFAKNKNFYQAITIEDTTKTMYIFKDSNLGDYNDDLNNILVYKRTVGSKAFKLLSDKNYCFVENEGHFFFQIKEIANINDIYLILNKLYFTEVEYYNETDLTLEEYLENGSVMKLDFVTDMLIDNSPVPIPVRNAKEVEIYINGLRLIPDKDFTLYNNAESDSNQFVSFSGILKPNSEVIMRNKNFGYYNYDDDTETDFSELYHYEVSMDSVGALDFSSFGLPIDLNYTETYVGRRRVDLNHRRVIANSVLKIDNQTCTNDIEVYFELNLISIVRELLAKYKLNLPALDSIYNTFKTQTKEYWFSNNEERLNTNANNSSYNQSEIFLGSIYRIQIMANPSVIYYGRDPEFTVYGFYEGSDVGTDITDNPELVITEFDKYRVGNQRIYATYRGVSDNIVVNVIEKEIVELKIITSTNLYIIGDRIKDDVSVVAVFEDDSQKIVTADSYITCSDEIARVNGAVSITAQYNGTTVTKYVLVSDSAERKVKNISVISSLSYNEQGSVVKFTPFVEYDNGYMQKVEEQYMDMYEVIEAAGVENRLPEFSVYNHDFEEDVKLKILIYTNSSKTTLYEYEDPNGMYVMANLLNSDLLNADRVVYYDNNILSISEAFDTSSYSFYRIKTVEGVYITIGENNIGEDSICFTDIHNINTVIVELLDSNNQIQVQKLFLLKNKNETKEIIDCHFDGIPWNGYTAMVDRSLIDVSLENISNTISYIIDKDNNIICDFIPINGGVDFVSSESNFIYLHFNNFSVTAGNVKKIADYLFEHRAEEDELFLELENCTKIIRLSKPTATYNKVGYSKIRFAIPRTNEKKIEITPNFRSLPTGAVLNHIYLAKPNDVTIFDLGLPERNEIIYDVNDDLSLLVRSSIYGHNIYYYEFKKNEESIYYAVDIEIGIENGRPRILSVNGVDLTERKYYGFPTYIPENN